VYCGVDIPLAAFLFDDFEASIEKRIGYNLHKNCDNNKP
jgi:hypothetical protein